MTAPTQSGGVLADIHERVVEWRRHLHRHPEVSFHEVETSQFVHDTLASFGGLELSRPTRTSVVARLRGGRPGKTLAMRADMDALPIAEECEHDFVSTRPGVMHACGHDGHTAVLLGVAKSLVAMRDQLAGEVRFIFQHAEELFPGGAEEMVSAGVMDGVDMVIGAHLWSPLPVGQVGVLVGPQMAAPDTFWITVTGRGGHAALPQQTVDSIAVAAQVVTNLQHVVARNVDPLDNAVVSVTQFHAGTTHNVIPGVAELQGTVRTFDPALRSEVPRIMERIVRGITEAHGAEYEFTYERGYRPVVNEAEATRLVEDAVRDAMGADALVPIRPTMGGEDFSAYQQKASGAFFFVGARNEERGIVHAHHHPRFDLDERSLDNALRIFVAAARRFLQ